MKRVIIESPYAANTKEGIDLNEAYAELAMHDCLVNYNESPYASHLLYTRRFVLRDNISGDRKLGIEAGFYWRNVAEKSVFYIDLGMTPGMEQGSFDCDEKEKLWEIRSLPDYLWEQLIDYCREADIPAPKRSVNNGISISSRTDFTEV